MLHGLHPAPDTSSTMLSPGDEDEPPTLAAGVAKAGATILGTWSLTSIDTLSPLSIVSTGSRPALHSKEKPSATRHPNDRTEGESSKTKAVAVELQLPRRTDTSLPAPLGTFAAIKCSPTGPDEVWKFQHLPIRQHKPGWRMLHYR